MKIAKLDDLVNLDYLKKSLAMSPQQRLEKMTELSDFLWAAMPDSAKQSWAHLRSLGF